MADNASGCCDKNMHWCMCGWSPYLFYHREYYQNCATLCYKILREGGVFTTFDTIKLVFSALFEELAFVAFFFTICEYSITVLDDAVDSFHIPTDTKALVSFLAVVGFRWIIPSFFNVIRGASVINFWGITTPEALAKRLISLATNGSMRTAITDTGYSLAIKHNNYLRSEESKQPEEASVSIISRS